MKGESWLPTLWGDTRELRDPFTSLRKQMDVLFDDWAETGRSFRPFGDTFAPRIDVSETDKELRVTAELPGVEQKDIEVAFAGDMLTIKGEKRSESEEKKDEKGRYFHRVERTYGAFQRAIAVPFEVQTDKIDAKFRDGILTVTVQKPAEVQKLARKIEIKKAA